VIQDKNATTGKFFAWRNAGKGLPRTRLAMLKVVTPYLKVDPNRLEGLGRSTAERLDSSEELDTNLLFVYWDIKYNGARLLDYKNKDRAIFQNLLMQAATLIQNYTPMPIGGLARAQLDAARVASPGPGVIYPPGRRGPPKLISDCSAQELKDYAANRIMQLTNLIKQWQSLGARASVIVTELRAAADKLEAAETGSVPPATSGASAPTSVQ
jgi:hypothetical protein